VLEAMSSKVPVLTSDVSSLPEVAGDAALMVDHYSEKEIYDASISLLENENLRKEFPAQEIEFLRIPGVCPATARLASNSG